MLVQKRLAINLQILTNDVKDIGSYQLHKNSVFAHIMIILIHFLQRGITGDITCPHHNQDGTNPR